eukprot:2120188-Heterocapsa_arctica.AAC.1
MHAGSKYNNPLCKMIFAGGRIQGLHLNTMTIVLNRRTINNCKEGGGEASTGGGEGKVARCGGEEACDNNLIHLADALLLSTEFGAKHFPRKYRS